MLAAPRACAARGGRCLREDGFSDLASGKERGKIGVYGNKGRCSPPVRLGGSRGCRNAGAARWGPSLLAPAGERSREQPEGRALRKRSELQSPCEIRAAAPLLCRAPCVDPRQGLQLSPAALENCRFLQRCGLKPPPRDRQTVGFKEGKKIQQHANVLPEFRSVCFDHFGNYSNNWIRESERRMGWENDTMRVVGAYKHLPNYLREQARRKKSSRQLQAMQMSQGAAPQLLLYTHLFHYGI
ncbi:uncharacterized protein LOC142405063 [Mycteria americana]|uniref:uncharacterized protein LOC142405063 n=1 Tax=Mycteria americana TaxID=33587 RepID=UPI003F58F270